MYNEDLKTRFVRDYTTKISSAKNCEFTFNAVEKYERKFSKDACQMNVEEIAEVVNGITGIRSQNMRITILRTYIRWCRANGVIGVTDAIFKLNVDESDKIRTKMVVSPLGLNTFLNALYDNEEEKTSDNLYRCFLWLAFSGLDIEDVVLIKNSDVNFATLSITYGGYDYPIYRESIASLRNCVELDSFVYKNSNYSNDILRKRIKSDLIFRGVRNISSVQYLQATLVSKNKEAVKNKITNLQLSFKRVWLSGMFYRAYEMEIAGFEVDFLDLANRQSAGKVYSVNRQTQSGKRKIMADNYMRDYEKWKIAFRL